MSVARSFNSGGLLFKAVAGLMGVFLLLTLAGMVSDAMELVLLEQLDRGFEVPQERLESNDTRQLVLGFVTFGSFIVLGICFLRTLYVLNRNARILGADDMSTTPGMTVGWFFIPFANLFKPYQAVRDIWKASVPSAGPWQTHHSSPLVGIWWGLWICSSLAGQVAFRITGTAVTIESLQLAATVRIISGLVDLPLAGVAIFLLYKLFAMQREKYERFGEAAELAGNCPACGEAITDVASNCPVCGHQPTAAAVV